VLVIGYPDLLPVGRGNRRQLECPLVLNSIDATERKQLNAFQDQVNQTIYEAAAKSGVEFVDPGFAWQGHEACGSKGGWINPALVNGLSPGPGSFHPTTAGQVALASIVACYLSEYPNEHLAIGGGSGSSPSTTVVGSLPPRLGTIDNPLHCTP
jgi:hypothetical protein